MQREREREHRLQQMRKQEHERRASETDQQREDRLQHMRRQEHERRAAETDQQREDRLQVIHESRQSQSVSSQVALIDQPAVRAKMQKFHLSISNIEVPMCMTCLESFPGMNMCARLNECNRCHRDQCSPKLFSHDNNMDPGDVPPQLQV